MLRCRILHLIAGLVSVERDIGKIGIVIDWTARRRRHDSSWTPSGSMTADESLVPSYPPTTQPE
jgi:hypothetical protein